MSTLHGDGGVNVLYKTVCQGKVQDQEIEKGTTLPKSNNRHLPLKAVFKQVV